nr:putative retrotransposon protein [Tanacetum cinerariifolium]
MKRILNVSYTLAVGSIMYDVRCTRPNVAFTQNITSRFQHNSGEAHLTAVKNILKYLRNTKDTFLVYGGEPEVELRVNCYCDAGFETDRDDTKSQTGYVFVLNGGSIDGVTTSLQLSQNLRLPLLDHQDKYMMKAQFAILPDSGLFLLIILICVGKLLRDNMANENVPTLAPTKSNDQLLSFAAWMLWGIITYTNADYAKLMWEEFVQTIQTFLADKANIGIPTKKGKKTKPHVIPYCWFTKLIIYYLGRNHNIYKRSGSPLNLAKDDLSLGNLKFVSKGEIDKVFGMKIPKELITNNIKNASYYNAYLEMVAKHDKKITAEEGGKKKSASKANKSKKRVSSKKSKPAPAQKPKRPPDNSLWLKAREVPRINLYNPKKRSTTDQFIIQRQTLTTLEESIGPSTQPQDDTSANIIRESPSPVDAETGANSEKTNSEAGTEVLNIDEEKGEELSNIVALEEKTAELDEGQAGSDPGKTPESQPPPEQDLMEEDQTGSYPVKSHMALAGPNPKPIHDAFVKLSTQKFMKA